MNSYQIKLHPNSFQYPLINHLARNKHHRALITNKCFFVNIFRRKATMAILEVFNVGTRKSECRWTYLTFYWLMNYIFFLWLFQRIWIIGVFIIQCSFLVVSMIFVGIQCMFFYENTGALLTHKKFFIDKFRGKTPMAWLVMLNIKTWFDKCFGTRTTCDWFSFDFCFFLLSRFFRCCIINTFFIVTLVVELKGSEWVVDFYS